MGMKPSHDQRKLSGSHKYTEEQLIRKISGIMQNSDFVFANGQIATEKELLTFMIKLIFWLQEKIWQTAILTANILKIIIIFPLKI